MKVNHLLKFVFLSIGLMLLFSGCSLMYRTVLGVDVSPQFYPNERIKKIAKRWNIESEQLYFFEREGYYDYASYRYKRAKRKVDDVKSESPVDSLAIERIKKGAKDDTQPVQVRMFDKHGAPLFKLVNCYIDPPIPLDWNKHGSFDEFPLKPHPDIEQMHHDSLQVFLSYLYTDEREEIHIEQLPYADYYIMVFWNKYFLRPSRKLIKKANKYVKNHEDKDIAVLYVSNHNASLWAHATDDQKVEIQKAFEKQNKDLPR